MAMVVNEYEWLLDDNDGGVDMSGLGLCVVYCSRHTAVMHA